MERLADGLWRWTAPHPEWRPRTRFGAEVASWAVHEGGGTVLVDPLLPEDGGDLLAALDGIVSGPVVVAITMTYHVRDAAAAARRWDATVIGHAAIARRLPGDVSFRAAAPGDELPLGLTVHAIGSPRRKEQPVLLPERGALAFGDAVVGVEDGLRVWLQRELDGRRMAWYRDRLVPSLEPLLALEFTHALVTHGEPVLDRGCEALEAALAAAPWYHPPH